MARPAVRIQVVEFGVLLGLALLVGRAAQVQILHGRRWAEEAQAQRTERIVLQARRGALYDRHGTPLAVTQETYHVGIAPNELRDPAADGALISRRLGLTAPTWQQALRRRYAYFAGPYSALEVQPCGACEACILSRCRTGSIPIPPSRARPSAAWGMTGWAHPDSSGLSIPCWRAVPGRRSC